MFRKKINQKKEKSKKTQILKIRKNARKLRSLSKMRIPKGLNQEEIAEVKTYIKWLKESSEKLLNMANKWQNSGEDENSFYNNEFLNLQKAMQHENRQFTMISNIMKVKHDTADSCINNIR